MKRDPYSEIHALIEEDWREHSACKGYPTEWWFPPEGNYFKLTLKARSICSTCPVKEECLVAALRRNEDGIWGGLNIKERRAVRKLYNVQKVLVCVHCRHTFEKPSNRSNVAMFCSDQCRKGRAISNEYRTRKLREAAS